MDADLGAVSVPGGTRSAAAWEDRVLSGERVALSVPFGLPGLVREQAQASPERISCVEAGRSITYRELELLSDAVAQEIAATVAVPGPVALRVGRGIDVVVAMLGVLKSGHAYLPIALAEPAPRLAAMVRLAEPAAVIDRTGEPELGLAGLPSIPMPSTVPAAAEPRPLPPVGAHDPLYVLFTSGSTGEPKGVVQGSLSVCNRLLWMRSTYSVGPEDRVLQKTPYTFDVSGWELFLPLISGGCCVFAPEGAHRDPASISALISEYGITLCHFVPSVLAEFVRVPGVAGISSLRALFTSGEALPPALARRTLDLLPSTALHNLYGPTEAAIDVTAWEVPRDLAAHVPVLIGSAIENTQLLVVDEEGRPVTNGEPGELWIGGTPLSEGYAGRQDLTEAAFPTAFGQRWYRTGDLTRWTMDGLEYLGRIDAQLKVDGVRIEPTEIEAVLAAAEGIEQVAVVPVRAAGGATRLVALTLPTSGAEIDAARLREFAAAKLPATFQPAAYLPLVGMPLSPNGKADRKRLAATAQQLWDERLASLVGAPLTAAWAAATGWDPTAAEESGGFLSSGGSSLGAVRLVADVRETLDVEIPIRLLLDEDCSLEQLRDFVAGAPRAAVRDRATEPSMRHRESPLTPAQHRLWLLGRIYPGSTVYNVVAVLRLDGTLDRAALVTALDAVTQRHDALRARVVETELAAQPLLRYAATTRFPVTFEETPELTDAEAESFAARVAGVPVPDVHAPMARAAVLTSSTQAAACLVLTANHLIADQQALDIVLGDIAAAYSAMVEGKTIEIPAAPSHAAHAIAEAAQAGNEAYERDIAYWRDRLAEAPAELDLPFRKRVAAAGGFGGAACSVRLDASATALLRRHLRATKATTATAVLAAFARVLAAWSGQETVVVGVPSSHRRDGDELKLVGFLVDTLPIRVDVAEHPRWPDLLVHVRERCLDALEHTAVPFDRIVQALDPAAQTSRSPVFQVWLNDLTGGGQAPSFAGLESRALIPPVTGSLFELGLYIHNDADGLALRLIRSEADWSEDVATALLDQVLEVLSRESQHEDLATRVLVAAEQRADQVAIVDDTITLSYGELRAEVERLAGALRKIGVSVGSRVEVRAARSPYLPVALLAVWRAGATAALLDSSLPTAHLEEAGSSVAATARIDVHANGMGVSQLTKESVHQDRLSHILFTSGTTGTPAAVAVPHGPLSDFLAWYTTEFEICADDRFAMFSGLGHDPVLRDMLTPLWVGARLHVPPASSWSEPVVLREWLVANEITVLHLTPGLLQLLTAAPGPRLDRLRLVVVGGAPLTPALVRGLREVSGALVVNAYGCTETPQIATCHRVPEFMGAGPDHLPLPVGRSVNSHEVLVRKPDGSPARTGELGEVVVRSRNLAAGYLGAEQRQGFTDTDASGMREYRTGDLGRIDPSGLIHVVGRNDRQVDLGGHRVELDEVEAVALRHQLVQLASAVVQESPMGPVLALHVGADPEVSSEALRLDLDRHLRALLPAGSVPGTVVTHAAGQFPGPRKAARVVSRPPRARSAALAGTALTRSRTVDGLVAALSATVGRPVGEEERFFDAGLNSVMLLQWHAVLVHGQAGPFPVTAMFSHPTARELAAFLDGVATRRSRSAPTAVALDDLVTGKTDLDRGELRRRMRQERRAAK